MAKYLFPEGFLWGTASSAYQIEGAATADGKGESIWDRFAHTPGNIWEQEHGDLTCDHYHRYADDIRLMADLGLSAYRFSVSWPRLFPSGGGQFNRAGLDFYRRLVEELLSHKIKPALTLYHWDLPQELQDRGGWANRDTARYFAEYATTLYERLDLPIDRWITLNEPWVVAFLGHAFGLHAPGDNDFSLALQVSHNLLLAHGLALQRFREVRGAAEPIGITLSLTPVEPASQQPEDQNVARLADGFLNRWFLDPLFKGEYPVDLADVFSRQFSLPSSSEDDMAIIAGKLDFLGINNYTRTLVEASGVENDFMGNPLNPPEASYTEMGWEVYPDGLFQLLCRIDREYGPLPLYVTENGAAFADQLSNDGKVNDSERINYLQAYLYACWRAIEAGIPLKGYYVWSLMDNFEWAFGYSKRFGLVYVDFVNQKRYLKESAHWYRQVIRRNGLEF